jgi:AcrR family transcriptional regulator
MSDKEDLRVIKTRNLLYSTLVDLLKDKPFEEIKVSDICDKALINRSTFYSHYADKYELFSSYVNDLKKLLTIELDKNENINNSKEYYLEMIKLFLNHIDKKDVYQAIMKNNRNSIIMDMVYDAFNQDVEKELKKDENKSKTTIPSSFVAKFYLGAVFSVGIEMLENKNKYTKKQILEYLDILIPNDLKNKD